MIKEEDIVKNNLTCNDCENVYLDFDTNLWTCPHGILSPSKKAITNCFSPKKEIKKSIEVDSPKKATISKKLYKEIITQLAIDKYGYKCKDCGLIYFDRESDNWCCKGSSTDPEHKAVCFCFTPHKGCHNYTDPKTWKNLVEIPEPTEDPEETEPEKKLTNHEKILERLKDPEIMIDYLQSCSECPIAESCAGRLKDNWNACRNKLKLWLKS